MRAAAFLGFEGRARAGFPDTLLLARHPIDLALLTLRPVVAEMWREGSQAQLGCRFHTFELFLRFDRYPSAILRIVAIDPVNLLEELEEVQLLEQFTF